MKAIIEHPVGYLAVIFLLALSIVLLMELLDPSIVHKESRYRVRVQDGRYDCYIGARVTLYKGPAQVYAYYEKYVKNHDQKLIDQYVREAIAQIPIEIRKEEAEKQKYKSFKQYRESIKTN